MSQRILYETHSHTPLCKHAVGEPEEYAAVALRQGLRGLTVTCHNPMPDGFSAHVRMAPEEFDDYVRLVERARRACADRVDILLGLEADYFPGYERWLERQLDAADFHYVLGSVHPQLPEFRERYWSDDPRQVQRTYFEMLADAAETGLFDCLAHPDLVKNVTAESWDETAMEEEIARSLDRIAATGMAMELNTSGHHKTIPEMNPFPAMLRAMRERAIPVVVGADAHDPERVGESFSEALRLLADCGYQQVSYFRQRRRHDVPIAAAQASLLSAHAA